MDVPENQEGRYRGTPAGGGDRVILCTVPTSPPESPHAQVRYLSSTPYRGVGSYNYKPKPSSQSFPSLPLHQQPPTPPRLGQILTALRGMICRCETSNSVVFRSTCCSHRPGICRSSRALVVLVPDTQVGIYVLVHTLLCILCIRSIVRTVYEDYICSQYLPIFLALWEFLSYHVEGGSVTNAAT